MPWIKLNPDEIRRRRWRQIIVGAFLLMAVAGVFAGDRPRTYISEPQTAVAEPAALPQRTPYDGAGQGARMEWWHRQVQTARDELWQPFHRCIYTERICLTGYRWVSSLGILQVLEVFRITDGDDREFIIDYGYCDVTRTETQCRYVYTGRVVSNGVDDGSW